MSEGHTPGPWVAHPIQRWVSPAADLEMPVCLLRYESFGVACDEQEIRANARLIAAAPDLLEALDRLYDLADGFSVSGVYFSEDCFSDNVAALKAAADAIAKATTTESPEVQP